MFSVPESAYSYHEQFDDIILDDNREREQFRIKATKAFLPNVSKMVRETDSSKLADHARRFHSVIKSHKDLQFTTQHYMKPESSLANNDKAKYIRITTGTLYLGIYCEYIYSYKKI